MLRIIIRCEDSGAVVYGGVKNSLVQYRTFDVELPEVEKFLTVNPNTYETRQVDGVELLAPEEAKS